MSIIRITEGEHITEIEKSWTVFTDEFEAYAGNFSHFTAKNGTIFGNPSKDKNNDLNYFKEGWWSSDKEGNNRITEAYVGDIVYFNIKMENVKATDAKVDLQLYDDDGWPNPPDAIDIIEIKEDGKAGNIIKSKPIINNKVSFPLTLSSGLIDFIEDDIGNEIELYFQCGYNDEVQVKLPYSQLDYLKVFEKEVLITVIIELPHSFYTLLNNPISALGLAGHSAMAIGDKYFDYGPDYYQSIINEEEYDYDFNRDGDKDDDINLKEVDSKGKPIYDINEKFAPGRPWWGEMVASRLKINAKDVTLNQVLDFIGLHWYNDGTNIYGEVHKIEFYVKESEANKMLNWWEKRYKHLKVYSVYPWKGEQCTTTVKTAIQQAFPFGVTAILGVKNWIPDTTQMPSGLLEDLISFKSSSKQHFDERAKHQIIKKESDDFKG